MFEGNLNYNDLERIQDELDKLLKIDLNKQQNCISNIYFLLNKDYSNSDINNSFILKNLINFIKNHENNIISILNYMNKIQKTSDYKLLSNEAKCDLDNIHEDLLYLKTNNINYINKSIFKDYMCNHEKIQRLLKAQIEIINTYIKSINLKEQKALNIKFIENETLIYRYLRNLNNKHILDFSSIRLSNCIFYDLYIMFKNLLPLSGLLIVFFTIFGYAVCYIYFIKEIGYVPDFEQYKFIKLGIKAFIQLAIVAIYITYSNFYFFKINNKIKINSIIFMQILLFVILLIPFIIQIGFLSNLNQNISNNIIYILALYIFCIFCFVIYNLIKLYASIKNIIIFLLAYLFLDFFIIIFVYKHYTDMNLFVFLYAFSIFLFARILSFSSIFEYKIIIICSMVVLLFALQLISANFVKYERIANYFDSFEIKKEHLSQQILDLPICSNDYNETCIDNATYTDNIKINNLFIRANEKDRYKFRAYFKKDIDATKSNIEFKNIKEKDGKFFIDFDVNKPLK